MGSWDSSIWAFLSFFFLYDFSFFLSDLKKDTKVDFLAFLVE